MGSSGRRKWVGAWLALSVLWVAGATIVGALVWRDASRGESPTRMVDCSGRPHDPANQTARRNAYEAIVQEPAARANPYHSILQDMLELEAEACALAETTGLDAAFVSRHLSTLRTTVKSDSFSPSAFWRDTTAREEAERASQRAAQRAEVVLGTAALALIPPVAVLAIGSSIAWGMRRFQLNGAIVGAGAAFVAAFFSLWLAAADRNEPPFTEEQWRLLGWTLLAIGGALSWRHHTRSRGPGDGRTTVAASQQAQPHVVIPRPPMVAPPPLPIPMTTARAAAAPTALAEAATAAAPTSLPRAHSGRGLQIAKGVLAIAVATVAAAVAGGVGQELVRGWIGSSASRAIRDAATLNKIADEMNRGLPMMVDRETEIMNTLGLDGVLVYNYRLVNHRAEDVDRALLVDKLRPAVVNNACSSPPTRDGLLKKGVTLRYNYSDQARRFITSLEVTPRDCGF